MKDYIQVERDNAALTIREYAFGQMNMLRMLGDEDAANNLQEAINIAIAALREQGWVRTSERVPTEADDGEFGVVLAYNKALSKEDEMGLAACVCAWVVREGPEWWTYWMPLPALPEVEG